MRTLIMILLLSTLCAPVGSQGSRVGEILDKFERARPTGESLAFYALDWAPSLKEAKSRAAAEGRPIFFIWLTNISAATSFFTGHC